MAVEQAEEMAFRRRSSGVGPAPRMAGSSTSTRSLPSLPCTAIHTWAFYCLIAAYANALGVAPSLALFAGALNE